MEKIIVNHESFPIVTKNLELEKIVLNNEQFLFITKQLGVTESLAKRALNLKKIFLPSVDGFTLTSYEQAKKMWRNSNALSMQERFYLIGMIRFALLEREVEGFFFEILDLTKKSVDEIGQMLAIRAFAQKILQVQKEKELVI